MLHFLISSQSPQRRQQIIGFDLQDWSLLFLFLQVITVFIQNYTRLGMDFWLTPGIYFLIFYLAACSIFFFKRYFLFSLAALFSLTISYCALFFTVDGYRILAVAITAPYIYITIEFIECLFDRNQRA